MAKQKIAILGGGVGSLTTAYELTSVPGWQDLYDITVYQLGWRLGGKGASGRNAGMHDRIEEHGLHIWMGFYENAFHAMRQVYEACASQGLSANSTFATCDLAFSRENFTPVMENYKGEWKVWPITWPEFPEKPGGQAQAQGAPPEIWDYVTKILSFMRERYDGTPRVPAGAHQTCGLLQRGELAAAHGAEFAAASSLHMAERYAQTLDRTQKDKHNFLADLLRDFLNAFRLIADLLECNDELRRLWIILETGVATVIGLIEDDVIEKGWSAIDDVDLIDWLARHDCKHANSPITIAMYDACFAYKDGLKPSFSAGTTLHAAMRLMFTYAGSIMWHMNAGMGDTIFTPYYLLLKSRGVKFEFFHKVTNIGVENASQGPKDASVTTIEFQVQATTIGEYDPLVQVDALKCWPNEPNWAQIVEAKQIQACVNPNTESWWSDWKGVGDPLVLRRGVDFDIVVQGISVGAFPYICKELEANPRWKAMVDHIVTVRTQGAQLWMRRTSQEMGWNPANQEKPVLCAYVEPFDTWADMSHLIPVESWNPADGMKSISYFCNTAQEATPQAPFSDPNYPATQYAAARENAFEFAKTGLNGILPGYGSSDLFNFGGDAFSSQFFRMNIDPSELYVICLPGTPQYRLTPGGSGFGNMILAGDWTSNSVNVGCVEAATISGMLASRAICGKPDFIYGAFGAEDPVARA